MLVEVFVVIVEVESFVLGVVGESESLSARSGEDRKKEEL
jgi:hypothetical protein